MHKKIDTEISEQDLKRFRSSLRLLERLISGQLKEETNCCGVTTAQCHVILELAERNNVHISDLADTFKLDRSTLSRTVEGLVGAGLAERKEDPSDRRHSIVSLTAKGAEKVAEIDSLCNAEYAQLFTIIGKRKGDAVIENLEILSEAMALLRESGPCCGKESPE